MPGKPAWLDFALYAEGEISRELNAELIRESPNIIDLGAGAGIVGIPWLLLDVKNKCVFIEPDAKKSSFLKNTNLGTEKGILVTRLWYIRTVDPQTLLLTGLTRDGTFYIENGKIKHPVKNFRFNESPVIMLNNLDALGKPERCVSGESGLSALIPPMRIRDFTFSSLSDAV